MSANGAIPNGTCYQKPKYQAEVYLKNIAQIAKKLHSKMGKKSWYSNLPELLKLLQKQVTMCELYYCY